MGAAVAVILMKERHIVDAFMGARATSAERAVHPSDLGVDLGRVAARRLVDRAVLREASPDTYYLDILSWEAVRRQRRRVISVILLVVAIAALILSGQFPPGAR